MKTYDRVEQALKYNQPLRDSDKMLLLHEWEKDGLFLTVEQQITFLTKCTPAETITRARRKLKDKYPASKEITEQRYKQFEHFRDNAGMV